VGHLQRKSPFALRLWIFTTDAAPLPLHTPPRLDNAFSPDTSSSLSSSALSRSKSSPSQFALADPRPRTLKMVFLPYTLSCYLFLFVLPPRLPPLTPFQTFPCPKDFFRFFLNSLRTSLRLSLLPGVLFNFSESSHRKVKNAERPVLSGEEERRSSYMSRPFPPKKSCFPPLHEATVFPPVSWYDSVSRIFAVTH